MDDAGVLYRTDDTDVERQWRPHRGALLLEGMAELPAGLKRGLQYDPWTAPLPRRERGVCAVSQPSAGVSGSRRHKGLVISSCTVPMARSRNPPSQ